MRECVVRSRQSEIDEYCVAPGKMMENYEDMNIRLGHINSKELMAVHEVKLQNGHDELNSFESSQSNFDFGAEILTTNVKPAATATISSAATEATTPATSETQPKANSEIKTKTLPQMGEQKIGANRNDKNQINELEQSDQHRKSLDKSFSEADDDDEGDEDENEDYKSRYIPYINELMQNILQLLVTCTKTQKNNKFNLFIHLILMCNWPKQHIIF